MIMTKTNSNDDIIMKNNNEDATLAAALSAVKAIQASAKENGIADMSLDEINAEIAAYRKEKSKHKNK